MHTLFDLDVRWDLNLSAMEKKRKMKLLETKHDIFYFNQILGTCTEIGSNVGEIYKGNIWQDFVDAWCSFFDREFIRVPT